MPAYNSFDEALINGFENHLATVDIESLPIAPYCKSYLQYIISHKKYYCRIYAHILSLALQHSGKAKENTCLLDYGAGNGLLGFFAKFCGFGKVYINDITPDFLHASKELAVALLIPADGFIEGDIDTVNTYFSFVKPDVVIGSDVIEHIYNLEYFFKKLQQINPQVVTVFTTASNPFNWFKVKELKRVQIKDELYGGSPDEDLLFGELPEPSFFSTRKKIIQTFAARSLDEEVIDKLASLSRGLIKADIENVVDNYLSKKILPAALSHPTNTCDPISGSWSERVMTLKEYENLYAGAGFSVSCNSGFYNQYELSIKSKLMFLFNKLIPFTGHRLAPFISLLGRQIIK